MAASHASVSDLLRLFGARFTEDRCLQIASSLTFMTLLALVPMITVTLAVAGALPVSELLLGHLRTFVIENMLPESVNAVSTYADQFSENAVRLTALGIAFLGATALLLLLTIDHAFNNIWRVSRPRPLVRRVLVYWTVLTVGPLLIGASLSLTSYLLTLSLGALDVAPGIGHAMLRFVPLALTSLALAVLYLTMPNCTVLKRDALTGGIAAGAGFEVMKHGFGLYITHFPAYALVYGAFATVPIFLLWIYLSWLTVIAGAVLVAALPEWRERAGQAQPVPGGDFFDALQVLKVLWRSQRAGEVVTLSTLHPTVTVRLSHLETILNKLVGATWVARSGSRGWVLSRDVAQIRVEDVYRHFVFDAAAHVPARATDQALEALVHDLAAHITNDLQMPLGQLFEMSDQAHPKRAATR